jgi:hypothetical protein
LLSVAQRLKCLDVHSTSIPAVRSGGIWNSEVWNSALGDHGFVISEVAERISEAVTDAEGELGCEDPVFKSCLRRLRKVQNALRRHAVDVFDECIYALEEIVVD